MSTPTEVLLIPTAVPARMVTVAAGDFRSMAQAIGAEYVEHVRTPLPGVAMLVDEEGLLRGRDESPVAGILYPGRIVGDVLVGSEVYVDGGIDVGTLTPEHLQAVSAFVAAEARRGL